MYAQQRSFLLEAKNKASHKVSHVDGMTITDYVMKLVIITSVSEIVRTRVVEELAAQGYVEIIERRRGAVIRFKLTQNGLEALDEGLKQAGKSNRSLDFLVNEDFKNIVYRLIDEISISSNENKQILLEIAASLKEEVNKENPRKSSIATMIGVLLKGINVSSDLSTIIDSTGVKAHEFIDFIKNLIK